MQDSNIVKAIPSEDISEFIMTIEPTKEELEIILSYGFRLLNKVTTINGTCYIWRKYYE